MFTVMTLNHSLESHRVKLDLEAAKSFHLQAVVLRVVVVSSGVLLITLLGTPEIARATKCGQKTSM
jgi:hypothetical protein